MELLILCCTCLALHLMDLDALMSAFEQLPLADRTKFLQVARGLLDPSDASGIPLCVRAFDDYYSAHVQPFLAVCAKLGDDGTALGKQVERAWGQQRDVLVTASQCKEPKDQSALKDLIAPLAASMKEINAAIKRNPFENNVKTVFEGAQALNSMARK